jgi:erythromycin esterase-like protein
MGDVTPSTAVARDPGVRAVGAPARSLHAAPELAILRAHASPLEGHDPGSDYRALAPLVAGAELVLIGDCTHGTHELYEERARLTRWLLEHHGFTDVAVEADWPDAARVDRFVRGTLSHPQADADASAALADFERFPRWMWRNTAVRDFVTWLRAHDDRLEPPDRAGFHGLDLYSLHRSMEAVIGYLATRDPEAASRARERYGCFDRFGDEPQLYGYATERRGVDDCESEVLAQLLELRHMLGDPDDRFVAEQNARLAKNAETYYRAMFRASRVE